MKSWFSRLLPLVFILAFLFASLAQPVVADETTVVLDGLRDSSYVQIASDPSGDLASSSGPADWTGTQWADLTALYAAADSNNLYDFGKHVMV